MEFLAQQELPEIPAYLYHEDYQEHKQYPMGIADIHGRLLGGRTNIRTCCFASPQRVHEGGTLGSS